MADDIVPYPDMPGESAVSDAALAVGKSQAKWAKTFDGSNTSLAARATRARHEQDIRSYAADLETRRMEESARRLATDKDAQDFYLRSKTLQLNEGKAYFDMAEARRKAEAAEEMAPLMFQAKDAQVKAQIANAARVARESAAKARMEEEADLFHAAVADASMQFAPDTPEYEKAILGASTKHWLAMRDPAAKAVIDSARNSAKARAERARKDAAAAATAAAADKAGLVQERISPAGTTWIRKDSDKPDASGKSVDLKKQIDALEEKRIRAKDDPELEKFYAIKKEEILQKSGDRTRPVMGNAKVVDAPVAAKSAPAATAGAGEKPAPGTFNPREVIDAGGQARTNPATGETRFWDKDGKYLGSSQKK
jgi:hypothetical protein